MIAVLGHVCLDVIPTIPRADVAIEAGRLIEVGDAAVSTGGAVANTGLALHRLGTPVRLVGPIGDDLFGHAVHDTFAALDPNLATGLLVQPHATTSYSVVINPPGIDRTFLHCPGANATVSGDDFPDACFADARLVHFGYPPLMPGTYRDGGASLAHLFERAHTAGVATSLDMADVDPASEAGGIEWPAWLATVLPHVDVFTPSVDELCFMLNGEAPSDEPSESALDQLMQRSLDLGTAAVMLKVGSRGLRMRITDDAERLARVPDTLPSLAPHAGFTGQHGRFDIEVVGTTGAGDCAIAGALSSLVRGDAPGDALRFACATAAAGCEAADATSAVPSRNQLEKRLAAGWVACPLDG